MARPRKTGIDYFSFDVDFLSDIKVRKILRSCGEGAIGIIISVLTNIYRDKGYFILVDDDFYFFIADELGITEDQVKKVIDKGTEVELFNKDLFTEYKILTSTGIQKRYMKATEKRKDVEVEKTYCLLSKKDIPGHINLVNGVPKKEETELKGEETPVSGSKSTQSKVKESKGKNSKAATTGSGESESSDSAFSNWEKLWLFPNEFQRQDLVHLIEINSDELVAAAIKLAGTKDVKKGSAINFIEAALKEWADNHVTSVEEAREYQKNRNQRFQQKNTNQFKNTRSESLPDWAKERADTMSEGQDDEPISAEEQAAFMEKLKRIRARKAQESEEAANEQIH